MLSPSHISCTRSCDPMCDSDICLFVLWLLLRAQLFVQGGGLEMHTEDDDDHFQSTLVTFYIKLKNPSRPSVPHWRQHVPTVTHARSIWLHAELLIIMCNHDEWLRVTQCSPRSNLSSPHRPRSQTSTVSKCEPRRLLCAPPEPRCPEVTAFPRGPSAHPPLPRGLPQSHSQACQIQNLFSWSGNFFLHYLAPDLTKTKSGSRILLWLETWAVTQEAETCRPPNHAVCR